MLVIILVSQRQVEMFVLVILDMFTILYTTIQDCSISTLLSPGCRAGPSPLSTSRVYYGDAPASLSGAVPATYTSSMHRVQPRTNIAYI